MTAARPTLRVAAIQMNSGADKDANIADRPRPHRSGRRQRRPARRAARGLDLPRSAAGEPRHRRSHPRPDARALADRARTHGIYLHAGSMLESRPGEPRLFNTTVVFDPQGEIVARYSKIHMFDVSLDGVGGYGSPSNVAPGDEIVTFEMDGVQVGLAICYDLRFPELFRILALRGAEVIVLPAAFTMTTGKDHWEILIRARAIENGVYMVAPGQVGSYSDGRPTAGATAAP